MSAAGPHDLVGTLAAHGLRLRGSWVPQAHDAFPAFPTLPALPDGSAPGVVCMVGVVGSEFWPHFVASPFFSDGLPDPLDRWSRAIGDTLAQQLGGIALYPFDGPPYHPFQRWADRAESTQPSRMMLRIHPTYGRWHAYRFALALPGLGALADSTAATPADQASAVKGAAGAEGPQAPPGDLCATCSGQPCLQACPVDAYTGETFVLQACASHLHSGAGADCLQGGCLARRACPVAPQLRYTAEHAAFHMQAFAERH